VTDAQTNTRNKQELVWFLLVNNFLPVTASVSAAVPAPQQYMFGAMK
jgi:hypothetical protein